nr:RNA-directed DNA polymerase, eukaryota [Tanacetum cinerariifolium]
MVMAKYISKFISLVVVYVPSLLFGVLIVEQYGHVVDSFIPSKRTKEGKRFGFVRFINVFNVDRLVNNLCTIWDGRLKLHANTARFQRKPLNEMNTSAKTMGENNRGGDKSSRSFGGAMGSGNSYINVLKSIRYLGELWVLLKFSSSKTKEAFRVNVGVPGWVPNLIEESEEEEQSDVGSLEGDNKINEDDLCGDNMDMADVPEKKQMKRMIRITVRSDDVDSVSICRFKKSEAPRSRGSFLCLMEEVMKVGQTMGYNMEGVVNNLSDIIESHGESLWHGEVVIMGDFNEVQCKSDRFGSHFNVQGANVFNSFIAGLEEVPIGGSAFTWCHKSATKMSKLDRFLVSNNLLNICPHISAITLERYLLDLRPILLHESIHDYGP